VQHLRGSQIAGDALRLGRNLAPRQPQPGQIGAKLVGQFRATARPVDVLDPHEESALIDSRPPCARAPPRHAPDEGGRWGWARNASRSAVRSTAERF
jgi:hypothetical protein